MPWERKPYDPNKVYRKPTKRQAAQREWLVTKGWAMSAHTIMTQAIHRCGLTGHQLKYHLEQLDATKYYVMKAADEKWKQAQKLYPKKERSKKRETITSS